jgi:hypothetical protein
MTKISAQRCVLLAALLLAAGASGCVPADGTPERAARSFLRAVKAQQCDRAWELFSADTRARIETRSRAALRNTPYTADYLLPRRMYCTPNVNHIYHSYLPRTARVVEEGRDSAVVRVEYREATSYLIPGFFPTAWERRGGTIRMAREDGGWRVALPDLPPAEPPPDPELGDVMVTWRKDANGEVRGFTAEHRIDGASPQTILHRLMDEATWPGIVPFLEDATPAGVPDQENPNFGIDRLMHARFGAVPGGIPVERPLLFATAGGRPGFSWSTVYWYLDGTRPGIRQAGELAMPPLQVKLELRALGNGASATLSTHIFDPARIPDGWTEALLDDIAAARLLHALERAVARQDP